MCLFLFPSEHDFNFPSCRALLQCSVLPEILPFYQGTILCMYIALRWKTLLAFLKIAAEDRRSHPWQCAKESNAGAPQGHFSRLLFISCVCKGTFEAKHWEDGERNQSSWMRNPGRCKNHAGTTTKYMALDLGENAMKINQKGRNSKTPLSFFRNEESSWQCWMQHVNRLSFGNIKIISCWWPVWQHTSHILITNCGWS